MAIIYRQGVHTQTTARLMFRGEDNGVVSVSCNGQTYQVTVDTAVMDGIVKADITGLSADTRYPFTITDVGGTQYSGTLKTMPSAGLNMVNFTCDSTRPNTPVMYKIAEQDYDILLSLGDSPYLNDATNESDWNGRDDLLGSADSPAASANTQNYIDQHVRYWYKPSFRYMVERLSYGYMGDDHEHANNDWAGDVEGSTELQLIQYNNNFRAGGEFTESPTSTGMAEIAAARVSVSESFDAIMQTNPDNNDAGIDDDAHYFRFKPNDDVEVFVIDCKSYCVRPASPNGDHTTKRMLGVKQLAWLIAQLAASAATFKLICSPKRTYDSSSKNADGWINFPDEMDYILSQIDANGVVGVVWTGGDRHNFGVFASYAGVNGAAYDHVCISAGDINQSNHPVGTWHAYQIYAFGGEDQSTYTQRESGYNTVYIPPGAEYCEIKMIRNTGEDLFVGRVYAGSNALTEFKDYGNIQV